MGDKKRFTSGRKLDHLRICIESDVEQGDAGFSDVRLLHEALPDCDMSKIRTNVRFLGHEFSSPLFIAAMTGGHPETREVNRTLARAARQFGIGMGVGSQRAALENPDLEDTYSVVREEAPESFIVANLGIVQLRDHGTEWAERAVEMIDADALAIHLNFLQEALQPEGDHNAAGCFAALADLCTGFSTPVIVKETGSGISAATARRCFGIGCAGHRRSPRPGKPEKRAFRPGLHGGDVPRLGDSHGGEHLRGKQGRRPCYRHGRGPLGAGYRQGGCARCRPLRDGPPAVKTGTRGRRIFK
jgi:isopentenyl-diphosphate delta-isomerase